MEKIQKIKNDFCFSSWCMPWYILTVFLFYGAYSTELIAQKEKYISHKTRKGENLTIISKRYNVSIGEILRTNQIKISSQIFVGQILKIRKEDKKRSGRKKKKYSTRKIPRGFQAPVKNNVLLRSFDLEGEYRTPGVLWHLRGSGRVSSSKAGKVSKVGYLRGYGKYVIIDHGNAWISLYSQLSTITVKRGNWITVGQKIGTSLNKKIILFNLNIKVYQ